MNVLMICNQKNNYGHRLIELMKHNIIIIEWITKLINYLELDIINKTKKDKLIYAFKINSFKKALKTIESLDFEIENIETLKEIKKTSKLPGIGKGTMERIDEILKTGKLSEIKDIKMREKYIDELTKIFGIGKVIAGELYDKHNIKNVSDLKKAVKNDKIDLPESVLKGIKYVDKIRRDIPREEIDRLYLLLLDVACNIDPNIDIRLCGSYRRESNTSNDIDILISHSNIRTKKQTDKSKILSEFINVLIDRNIIVESLTSLNVSTKYMGICRIDKLMRRIDIRFIPKESYYTALIYFTGSRSFNQRMRMVAMTMNYKLNEYGLYDSKGKSFKISCEKDIFDMLNMEYVQPKYR